MSDAPLRRTAPYRSVRVELLRQGDDDATLRRDIAYLVQVQNNPVRQVFCGLGHLDFLDRRRELACSTNPATREVALKALSTVVTDILDKSGALTPLVVAKPGMAMQLDLVVTAGELSALPFELACSPEGGWMFPNEEPSVEITRRVRLDLTERPFRWPAKPRVLFVAASPPGAGPRVPSEAVKGALRSALKPWIEPLAGFEEIVPDERDVLLLLENASLSRIRAFCEKAAGDGKPITHVHVLAHGIAVGPVLHRQHFGLALHGEQGGVEAVEPDRLVEALRPILDDCAAVTLAVCHGGDVSNTLLPGSSVAHRLHAAGVPAVIGCQFPLTFDGAIVLTERFYTSLLQGEDVRAALHAARTALFAARETTQNDWAALVGYVRLPEGYADQLVSVALEADLAALRTTHAWFDRISRQPEVCEKALTRVAEGFQERIGHLERRRAEAKAHGIPGVLEENLGLLGSGEKRLAEVRFRLFQATGEQAHRDAMFEALERARGWYRQCFRHNLSHHWTGVQALSLEAILDGKIGDIGLWYAAVRAAEIALEDETEYWAAGSLMELYLLARFAAAQSSLDRAAEHARLLAVRAPGPFPVESTARQLERYSMWWTTANGFFPHAQDLVAESGAVAKALARPDAATPQH